MTNHRTTNRTAVPTLLASILGMYCAACGDGESSPAETASTRSEPASEASAMDPAPSASAAEAEDDSYTVRDPAQALARIPREMRPSVLHDKLQLLVPNVAAGGRAMFTDIVTIEGGDDVTYCTYVDGVTEDVTYLHDSLGSQTKYGHHAILQYTTSPQEPGTRLCSEGPDSGQMGQVLGGTGGEGTTRAVKLPSNIVSEIPAGAQFIINHHWINYSEEPVEVQAEMITVPPESDQELSVVRAVALVVLNFMIPPGASGRASGEFTFQKDIDMITVGGHQHKWGTHVRAERTGSVNEMIFDHDYDPSMVAAPKTNYYPVEAPYHIAAGDKVRMSCEWVNTSDKTLTNPGEMCIFFGWQLGAEKDLTAYNGEWF